MIYIANNIDTNVRELEGALIRVVAYSSLINQDISVHLAAEALKGIIPSSPSRAITIQKIQQRVGEFYGLRPKDFKERKRTKAIAFPRQVAMYLVQGTYGFLTSQDRRSIRWPRPYYNYSCT